MSRYRAYLLGKNGQILDRREFDAPDHQAALRYAGEQIHQGEIEVWLDDNIIGAVTVQRQA